MTENWAIALLSVAVTMQVGVLGWMAHELSCIKDLLATKVDRADCRSDMGHHCDMIDAIRAKVQENSEAIAKLEGRG